MSDTLDVHDTTSLVKDCALQLGFDLVCITSAEDFAADREVAIQRIAEGRMDGLPWFTEKRVRRGASPEELLPGARSIISVGLNYFPGGAKEEAENHQAQIKPDLPHSPQGKIARYARGRDYHRVMKHKDARPGVGIFDAPLHGSCRPLVRGRRPHAGPGGSSTGRLGLVRQEY